jgi:NAD(P)-dependent dehydrogenase (short-subunit alcohol dehydrogenase family)
MNYYEFLNLKGKRAVITGGNNGLIGPILSETLRNVGCEVFAIDLPECDLTKPDTIITPLDFCSPNILIHNAGVDSPPIPGSKSDFWGNKNIMDVNYHGGVETTKRFIDNMKLISGIKHIIFIGSVLGSLSADHRNYNNGFDKPVTYGASKRALFSLTQNLATRFSQYNILVNMISFSMVDGKGINDDFKSKYLKNVPIGRPIFKDDIQRVLLGVLMQSYVTGQEIKVFGGYDCW